MDSCTIRRVPWTSLWGRFGVTIEEIGSAGPRVDDVFWACHHPTRAPHLRLTKRLECEECPFWQPTPALATTEVATEQRN